MYFGYRAGPDNQKGSRSTVSGHIGITRESQTGELNSIRSVQEVEEARAEQQPPEQHQQVTIESAEQDAGPNSSSGRSSDAESEADSDKEADGYDEIPDLVAGSIHKQEKRAFWKDLSLIHI